MREITALERSVRVLDRRVRLLEQRIGALNPDAFLPPDAPPAHMVGVHEFVDTYGPNRAKRTDGRCNLCERFADHPVHSVTRSRT